MPDSTPTFGLPYPNLTDTLRAAVSTIPKALAEQLESTLKAFGGVANPGAWQTLAPITGTNQGTPLRNLGYAKAGHLVYARGRLLPPSGGYGAGTKVFTFPVGYRPTGTLTVLLPAGNPSYVRADVLADGSLIIQDSVTAFVNLDTLLFTIN